MKRIVINSSIRHGKPTIEGTRFTVEDVIGMLCSGMTYEEIKEEYGLEKEDILAVMRYIASLIHGEEVRELSR